MGLIDIINSDIQRYTSDEDGFAVPIAITNRDDSVTLNTFGLHTKHRIGVDNEGQVVNTMNAQVTIHEKNFVDASFVYRNSKGEVSLNGYKVVCEDSTGLDKNYIIAEAFPDETIGLIVCILQEYDTED